MKKQSSKSLEILTLTPPLAALSAMSTILLVAVLLVTSLVLSVVALQSLLQWFLFRSRTMW